MCGLCPLAVDGIALSLVAFAVDGCATQSAFHTAVTHSVYAAQTLLQDREVLRTVRGRCTDWGRSPWLEADAFRRWPLSPGAWFRQHFNQHLQSSDAGSACTTGYEAGCAFEPLVVILIESVAVTSLVSTDIIFTYNAERIHFGLAAALLQR